MSMRDIVMIIFMMIIGLILNYKYWERTNYFEKMDKNMENMYKNMENFFSKEKK